PATTLSWLRELVAVTHRAADSFPAVLRGVAISRYTILHAALASGIRRRLVRQPEAGECHAGEADAEFLQRRAAGDRLGQVLGEFIELVVHSFSFRVWLFEVWSEELEENSVKRERGPAIRLGLPSCQSPGF